MTPDAAQQFEYMSLDDFEELLLDKPRDEKWELIGGRVIRGMVGARWEHKQIVLNLILGLNNHFRKVGSPSRAFDETFWLKEHSLDLGSPGRAGILPQADGGRDFGARPHRARRGAFGRHAEARPA
jgi:hypothetical protein